MLLSNRIIFTHIIWNINFRGNYKLSVSDCKEVKEYHKVKLGTQIKKNSQLWYTDHVNSIGTAYQVVCVLMISNW